MSGVFSVRELQDPVDLKYIEEIGRVPDFIKGKCLAYALSKLAQMRKSVLGSVENRHQSLLLTTSRLYN